MKRDQINIFENENGEFYAYTDDLGEATNYIDRAIAAGYKYSVKVNGIATVYTIITK